MTPPQFRYYRDPLFLVGCAAYAINRWLVKPHVHTGFMHDHFNDCWLIPCALPLVLWVQRRLGLRPHNDPPRLSEIVPHLIFWSILFKGIGPKICPWDTPDLWDIPCYWGGGLAAWVWWNRESLFRGRAPVRRITNIEPWPRQVVENAYKKIGGEWDKIEAAATSAQGKPDFNN